MKKYIILLIILIAINKTSQGQPFAKLTLQDAVSHVSVYYETNANVDYYVSTDVAGKYSVFVDEEPGKGWEHNCTLYLVNTRISGGPNSTPEISVQHLRLPPQGMNLTPYYINNNFRNNASLKMHVANTANTIVGNNTNTFASNTYAVIISGGVCKNSNYGRYWNNCSFIYQTLRNKYGIPKGNITLLMADGDNPADDMMKTDWTGYQSSPLDLDFDGQSDLYLAATRNNVDSVFTSLSSTLSNNDHLFVYVIDHGGYDSNLSESYICLWNNERLYANELETLIDSIEARSVNCVFGQCYSGGFVNVLSGNGRVIATACGERESSWACPDIPYDEFVYQWTCAVNEIDKDSIAVHSDCDENKRVTMLEAFGYASANDRQSETPVYNSCPISVGEDLAFNNIPEGVDLYIRDNYGDTGKEPNTTTDRIFCSPDIYLRNQNDGFDVHISESPDITPDRPLYLYAIVKNRGTEDYTGDSLYVHFYWAHPTLFFDFVSFTNDDIQTCAQDVGYAKIGRINAGEEAVIKKTFVIPEFYFSEYPELLEQKTFSLVGHITNYRNPNYRDLERFEAQGKQWVRNCNDLAVRNYYIAHINRDFEIDLDVCVPDTIRCKIEFKKDYDFSYEACTRSEMYVTNINSTNNMHGIRPKENNWLLIDSCQSSIEEISIFPDRRASISFMFTLKENIENNDSINGDFFVFLREIDTNNIIGGAVIHVENDSVANRGYGVQSTMMARPCIESVDIDNNYLAHISLDKALTEDIMAVIGGNEEKKAISTQVVNKGTKDFYIQMHPSDKIAIVSLKRNNVIMDSKKIMIK